MEMEADKQKVRLRIPEEEVPRTHWEDYSNQIVKYSLFFNTMKKLFSSLLAVTFALSSMAAETAYVRMKLAGSNPTYSTSTIKLTENSDRTPAYESGYDSERMMEQSNDNSVLFYAYVGTQECANIATNNLDNLVLCFNTNNIDQNYTISFELVSGRDLTLYDKVTNTSTPIVQGQSYPFSVEAAQVGRVAIVDRFVINGTPVAESLCFNNNILEVNGYAGKSLVIKQGTTEIENIPSLPAMKAIPLGAYSGRLVVTLDKKDYQIDVNPTVTPYTPAP